MKRNKEKAPRKGGMGEVSAKVKIPTFFFDLEHCGRNDLMWERIEPIESPGKE